MLTSSLNKMDNLRKLSSIQSMFFDTPMLAIKCIYRDKEYTIYVKYEAFNFSGSIKDRMAYFIYKRSYENDMLKPGDRVVEVTSGNTGIALTALGKYLGHEVSIIMPDWLSEERYKIIRLMGGDLILTSREDGFQGAIDIAVNMSKEPNVFYPDQFSNKFNAEAHEETTAKELVCQLSKLSKSPDHFVAGVGTGGTIMGFFNYFGKNNIKCKCYPIEPECSPVMTNGGKDYSPHKIQGIGDDFIPALIELDKLDDVILIDDNASICMAKKLSNAGISVGISSGANFLSALKIAEKHPDDVVCTVFADSALKYLSGDMCSSDFKENSDYMSNDVKILDYFSIK